MRKILPLLITATVLLTPLYPVYAQPALPPGPPNTATTSPALRPGLGNALSDQVMARNERLATRAAELKAKLAKFKDKAKAQRLDAINNNLNTVNVNFISAMQNNLNRISEALTKLKTKATEAESAGKDVSSLKSDIVKVEAAWTAADTALKAQMEKDYTVTVNTESTIKADAQSARNTLRTDLKIVHDSIIAARQSLASAIKNALSSMGGTN